MVTPFEIVHVDMVGSWKVKFVAAGNTLHKNIQALNMVDRATNWLDIAANVTKESRTVIQIFGIH